MASQIAHIIYTNRFFKKLDSGEISSLESPLGKIERDDFLLGSVFPDIRRIDSSIKRKDTHMHFPQIDLDFSGLTSFEAGWKFHLYCDMKREEILNKYDFYKLDSASDFYGLSAKLLEDEWVYDEYDNWEKINWYFNHPSYHPVLKNVTEETFKLWYAIMAKYMEKKPNNSSIRVFLSKQGHLVDKLESILNSLEKIRENKKSREFLMKIKEEIV
jgi:hypothetical protein